MSIDKLLKPNKICVVGASEKEGFGGDTCRNVVKYMDESRYFFVNPKRDEIFGQKAYHSIAEVPEQFDLAILCTPLGAIEDLLRQAKDKGAAAAVVYASGYSEVGTDEGREAQRSLIETARELGLELMGPNCAGFINYLDSVYAFAFISEDMARRGSVGFVSQSGQLCLSMMDHPASFFSYCISAGNAAVTSLEDYVDFLVDDEDTKVVAIYFEGVKNPRKFADSLRKAAEKRKPVIVLKTGRSEKGKAVAASHTGSLAGADRCFDALFEKFGVIRTDDLEEFIYTAQLFATLNKLPKGASVASMNLSGGETGICADVGELFGISYPDFEEKTVKKLKGLLPGYASVANPLDMTATLSYDTEKYAEVLRTVMYDPNISLVSVGYTLLERISDPAIYYIAEAIKLVSGEAGAKPIVMLPFAGNTRNPEYRKKLEECGVTVLPPPVYGMRIIKSLCRFAQYDYSAVNGELAIPERPRKSSRVSLSEHEGKELLARFGVPVPEEGIATSAAQAVKIAGRAGYPVVMKVSSPDILHKSDCGGVVLDIKDEAGAAEGYRAVLNNVKARRPDASIEGVLIQRMVKKGLEFIVGVYSDPQFGPAVMVGMGGIFVEVFKDTAMRLAPVSESEAREMVMSLKASKLLLGCRGSEPCDIAALVKAVASVSEIAAKYKDSLLELDVNPLLVDEDGVYAVDAVAVFDEQPE